MRIMLVDCETTGVTKDAAVCEVAWAEIAETKQGLVMLNSHTQLIDPGIPIPYAASAINGLTDDMVVGMPTLDEYMAGVGAAFSEADVVSAHNYAFDIRFLGKYAKPEVQSLCTLRCARVIYPESENHKLSTLAYYLGFGLDRSKAHSADGDVAVLFNLVKHMCEQTGLGIAGLLALQDTPRQIARMPFGKWKGTLLKDMPADYIHWLLTKANIDDDLRTSLQNL